jgi:peptidyl-prolyl cis-trans isomerase A (cyclophilin A)
MIRLSFIAACLLCAAPAFAQDAPPAPPAPPPAPAPAPAYETVRVELRTAEGPIVLELEKQRAPLTTANFLRYIDQKRLDGATFYRALSFPGRPDLGLIQGGQRNQKLLLPPVAHEATSKTGLTHKQGTISMARAAPGSAQSDFFIILGDLSTLDANPNGPPGADNAGFAAFGRVVEGMDVVQRILASPVSPTEGVGAMKGQMIAKPVPIQSARRLPK